jgi:hypothetical protein
LVPYVFNICSSLCDITIENIKDNYILNNDIYKVELHKAIDIDDNIQNIDIFDKWFDEQIYITKNKNDIIDANELIKNYILLTKSKIKNNSFGKKMRIKNISNTRSTKIINGTRPTFYIGIKFKNNN